MSILEVIGAIVIIFTSFYLIFKPPQITSGKETANLFVISRDFLQTLDNINHTYFLFTNMTYSDEFSGYVLRNLGYAVFFSTKNLIKPNIIVAANCSTNQIRKLYSWFGELKFNRREVSIYFIPSNLSKIPDYSNLLIICDYKNLTDYRDSLLTYLSKGKGILGFFDFPSEIDKTSIEIFGLQPTQEVVVTEEVMVHSPVSVYDHVYIPYKYFYNLPLMIKANETDLTTGNYLGYFTFRNYVVRFEINSTSREVKFYTTPETRVRERENFRLFGYNFTLSYVTNYSISVSFKKTYNFTDFTGPNRVKTVDEDQNKIFLYSGIYNDGKKVPVSTINTTRVAWIANFDRYDTATHDQKLALLSLILTVSEKVNYYGTFTRRTILVPFVDVENYDVLEIYFASFGLGLPY